MGHLVDNSAIRRKLATRGAVTGMTGFGDYPADLPNRVLSTKGGAGQEGGAAGDGWGPVTAPVIPGERPETMLSLLHDVKEFLRLMPQRMLLELRSQLAITPREAVSFVAMSGTVSVPAASAVAVVSQTVQPRFAGFITKVGVNVVPPGSFPDISWSLRINGQSLPEFFNRIYSANNLANPDDFVQELIQGRTVELVATNTSLLAIDVQGKLVGWTEFLTDNKPYGGTTQSSIS